MQLQTAKITVFKFIQLPISKEVTDVTNHDWITVRRWIKY